MLWLVEKGRMDDALSQSVRGDFHCVFSGAHRGVAALYRQHLNTGAGHRRGGFRAVRDLSPSGIPPGQAGGNMQNAGRDH